MKNLFPILSSKVMRVAKTIKFEENSEAVHFPYDIKIIAENCFIPWAIAISNEAKTYFTERSGTIRIMEEGYLYPQPLITFGDSFVSQGEGGLMGIALDPNYSQNHYIYVMHYYAEGNQLYNRIVRLVERNNKAFIDRILLDKIPGGPIHNGGRIKIGPDQKLYIATGDAGNPSSAQDEINIIEPGGNYGCPLVQGNESTSETMTIKPVVNSGEETWAPSGIDFVNQGTWQGKLLVAALRGEQLLAITLNKKGTQVTQVESLLKNQYGRLREVVQANDGSIYLTTSNRDGRGISDATDDKIIMLVPQEVL